MKPIPSTLLLRLVLVLALGAHAGLAPPAAAQEEAQEEATAPRMLRMRSGDLLWGSVLAHTSAELRFRRLDTGGVVTLPWSLLAPVEEEALRRELGYAAFEPDELQTDAELLTLADGTEVVGVIVNRTDEHLWVKNNSGVVPVAKRSLRGGSTRVRVPALEIYTKEELYQQKHEELRDALLADGLDGARAHDELARTCERLFDYAHAVEHYGHVRALAPEYDAERVEEALAQAREKAALAEQLAFLSDIETYRARRRYDLAQAGLELFAERYPDSPLEEDWLELRDRVQRHQQRDVDEEIVDLVHAWAVRLARSAARKRLDYDAMVAYLEEGMTDELLAGVQQDLQRLAPGIEPEEIRARWLAREGGRHHRASFGLGTWLLGEARALATYDEEEDEEPAPAAGSQAAARRELEERVGRYLRNQELARQARSSQGAEGEEDPAVFWKAWDYAGRYQWALAYFAEYSGLFRVERVRFSACRECGGKGVREVLDLGSARQGSRSRSQLYACRSCRTLGHVRRIRYR